MAEATATDTTDNRDQKRPRRTYTEAEVEQALATLAKLDGNVLRAVRVLERDGLEIPEATLREWKTRTKKRDYMRALIQLAPHLKAARHDRLRKLARRIEAT